MLFDDVVVPNVGLSCCQRLASKHIHSEWLVILNMSLLDLDKSVLRIKARVLGQSARNGEKSFSEADNTELRLSRNFLSSLILHQVLMGSDFEGTTAGNNRFVKDGV